MRVRLLREGLYKAGRGEQGKQIGGMRDAGWGRIHVRRADAQAARYLAKYLSKDREPCFKRWRLWAGFGDILGIKGGTLAKQWFVDSSRTEVFQNAISDFKTNAEEHIRFFREN